MSKSFSHSSLGRDLPPHPRRDTSRMGPGPANQPAGFGRTGQGSSRVGNLMDSKMGQQRSHLSSGSSSQSIPSIFRLGSRGPAPLSSQPARESDHASRILASFGLSSIDLDELSRFPEDKITAENLPEIIQHLKRKRSEHMELLSNRDRLSRDSLRPSSDNWDDLRPLRRASFDDRPSGLNPVVDYGHGGSSRDLSYRDRLDIDDALRDRERLRDDRFLSEPSFRKSESDYNRMGYGSLPERPMFEKSRGMPSGRKIDDFHGLPPKDFPHLCSLCDLPVNNFQSWDEHISGRLHKRQCLVLLDLYPEWNPRGMGGDPFMLPQSTNPAPGILGPPPPPMPLGGPNPRHGNFRGPPGPEDMPGPRHMPGPAPRPGTGRVVHVVDFERGRNLKQELIKLVEPFGIVTNSLILNNLNEAFIEMSTPAQAVAVVSHYDMNPPYVFGKIVRVFLSQKYKRIKKDEEKDGKTQKEKSESKQEPKRDKDSKQETGCVLRICNLPQSGYSDSAIVKLAETYGKVRTYILMRMKSQAFIEMEKAEDAQSMINRCEKSPLFFQGRALTIGLSQKYKKLVLRIPNNSEELDKRSRKRAHSPDGKDHKDKQKKREGGDTDKAELVTTEETDLTSEETDQKELVSSCCEPELGEEDEDDEDEDEEAAAALLETSGSGDEAEVPDITDLDQSDANQALEPHSSTPAGDKKRTHAFRGKMGDFVTLDEMGDEEDNANKKKKSNAAAAKRKLNSVTASAEEAEQEHVSGQGEENMETNKTTDSALDSEANTEEQTEVIEVGPYQVNNPVGVDFVIPKTGFYCKLCSLFYTSEDVAKVTHCSTLAHYKKFKDYYSKPGKNLEKKQ